MTAIDVRPLGLAEVGQGPVGVAVHGGLGSGRLQLEPAAARWGADRRWLVVDRPGFERTPGPEEPVGLQARRLLATIHAHGDGDPVDAVACSFGGLVLLRAVEMEPTAFRRLVIVESPAIDLCPPRMVHPQQMLQITQAAHAEPDMLDAAIMVMSEVDPGVVSLLRLLHRANDPRLSLLRGDLAIWAAMLDRSALADAVSGERPIPVLTVSGSNSHQAFRTFGACTAAALFGHHTVIEGAGHAAQLHPGFGPVLRDFLAADG